MKFLFSLFESSHVFFPQCKVALRLHKLTLQQTRIALLRPISKHRDAPVLSSSRPINGGKIVSYACVTRGGAPALLFPVVQHAIVGDEDSAAQDSVGGDDLFPSLL